MRSVLSVATKSTACKMLNSEKIMRLSKGSFLCSKDVKRKSVGSTSLAVNIRKFRSKNIYEAVRILYNKSGWKGKKINGTRKVNNLIFLFSLIMPKTHAIKKE